MNDPLGVELTEIFETEIQVISPQESDEFFDPFVSVNFFNCDAEGNRINQYPENNRTFSGFTDFEGKTDEEIINILTTLVPELK